MDTWTRKQNKAKQNKHTCNKKAESRNDGGGAAASYKNCGYAYFFLYSDDKDNVYKHAVATYNKTIRDSAVIMNLQS